MIIQKQNSFYIHIILTRYYIAMAPSRIKRRATYTEIRRFRNVNDFRQWWHAHEIRWRMDSRQLLLQGSVEYWRCAFIKVWFFVHLLHTYFYLL